MVLSIVTLDMRIFTLHNVINIAYQNISYQYILYFCTFLYYVNNVYNFSNRSTPNARLSRKTTKYYA